MKKLTLRTDVIENGITGREIAIAAALKSLEGKRAKITIEQLRKQRTQKQNRYWFGVCIPILRQVFIQFREPDDDLDYNDPEVVHYLAKLHIWQWFTSVPFMGGHTVMVRPSPEADTEEWNNLMKITQKWAAERGYQIPDPQEVIPDWVLQNVDYDYNL